MDSTQLWESITSIHEIHCDFCKNSDSEMCGDDFDACSAFYHKGWRARKKTYCPECAKKKLKKSD